MPEVPVLHQDRGLEDALLRRHANRLPRKKPPDVRSLLWHLSIYSSIGASWGGTLSSVFSSLVLMTVKSEASTLSSVSSGRANALKNCLSLSPTIARSSLLSFLVSTITGFVYLVAKKTVRTLTIRDSGIVLDSSWRLGYSAAAMD